MLRPGRGVTISATVLLAVIVTGLAFAVLKVWSSRGNELSTPSWTASILLVLMAAAVLAAGYDIRRYQRGESRRMPSPLRARRTLVAAQASALTGAAMIGWYLAQVLVIAPNADVPTQRSHLLISLATAGAALLLSIAGLVAQWMCRIPPEDDDTKTVPRSRRSGRTTSAWSRDSR